MTVACPRPRSTTRYAGSCCWPRGSARSTASTRCDKAVRRPDRGRRAAGPRGRRRRPRSCCATTAILPLAADELRRVAVIGPGARDARPLGGGSAIVPPAVRGDAVRRPDRGARRPGRGRDRRRRGAVRGAAPGPADELSRATEAQRRPVRWLDAAGDGSGRAGRRRRRRSSGCSADVPEGAVGLELQLPASSPDEDGDWRLGVVGFGAHRLDLDGDDGAGRGTGHRRRFDVHAVFAAPPQHVGRRPAAAGQRRRRPPPLTAGPADAFIFFGRAGRRPPRCDRPTRSSPTPSSWRAPATSPSSSSAPPRRWRARASTGRP